MNKRLIVVLGMHRSGTSAITRGLKAIGIDLGQNLMPPSASQNMKGFWEDQDINALNIELLCQLTQGFYAQIPGQDWHSIAPISDIQLKSEKLSNLKQKAVFLLREKTRHSEIFGIKDPRMCRLLPFWKEVFSHLNLDVSYIIVSRNPLSVAHSLAQRNGFKTEKCHYLWLEHMLPGMTETVKAPRVIVDYDRLMEQPEAQILRIAKKLNLAESALHTNELEDYKNKFIDQSLRHNYFQPEDLKLDPSMPEPAIEAYGLFRQLATDELSESDSKVCDRFNRLNHDLIAMAPSLRYITELEDQLTARGQAVADRDEIVSTLNQTLAEREGKIHSLNLSMSKDHQKITSINLTLAERESQIHSLNLSMAERNRQIHDINQNLAERDQKIHGLNLNLAERDQQIHGLNLNLAERDQQIHGFNLNLAERDRQIHDLNLNLAERDRQIHGLNLNLAERDRQIHDLNLNLAERDQKIHTLNLSAAERDQKITHLNQTLAERDKQIHHFNLKIAEYGAQIKLFDQNLAERDRQIHQLNLNIADHEKQVEHFNQAISNRDEQISLHHRQLAERDEHIHHLNLAMAEREQHIDRLNQTIANQLLTRDEIMSSTSWKITRPIRFIGHQHKRVKHVCRILPHILKHGGGITATTFKTLRVLKKEGLQGVKNRLIGLQTPSIRSIGNHEFNRHDYAEWIRRYDTLEAADRQDMIEQIESWSVKPKISIIIPVYDPPLSLLNDAIESIKQQIYPEWELCIADDASKNKAVRKLLQKQAKSDKRIKVVYRQKNGHISAASNSAIEIASGEYLALFDHDDLLPEHALYEIAKTILRHPDAGVIYSDEDKIDLKGLRHDPYFKSDWNPELFLSHNMISHLGVYKTSLVRDLGGFRIGFEGSQDYDLALRCIEKLDKHQIIHIPKVLYHWRVHPESTASSSDAKPYALISGQKAIAEHLARRGTPGKVELLEFNMYRVRYKLPSPKPLVSLIIPTRNGLNLIKQCIDSIVQKTSYPNYEIIIVDNASDDAKSLRYFKSLQTQKHIKVIRDERPFNYSALNNAAVKIAKGKLIGLINNDIEVISPDWLTEMVSLALQPGAGAVGAKLWYPNDTLQHGGVILGAGGVAGHSHSLLPKGAPGYFARAGVIQSLSAVTAACLIVLKSNYQQIGGLNEVDLAVAFNDVDFCLRLREAGYRNIWTPYAELYHHESASRGSEDTPEKQARFLKEVHYMMDTWGDHLLKDPAYNPNLTLDHLDFGLAWPPRG